MIKFGIIYMATSLTSGKSYIGQTLKTLEDRIHTHKIKSNNRNTHFYCAIRKYGFNDFVWEVLLKVKQKYLNYYEQHFIFMYDTFNSGYNSTTGGRVSNLHSQETKKKISLSNKGKNVGINHHFFGKHHTNESKKKISKANKGIRAGTNHPFFGKKHTEISKNKISESLKQTKRNK